MANYSRRAALTAIFGAGLWSVGARAQQRDLTVEAVPHHPSNRRPGRPYRAQPPAPVQASLTPIGPSTVEIGQPVRFRMVSLSHGFGHLYVLSASGRSQVWLENVRVRAGAPVLYPQPGLIVRAAAPAGDEVVLFLATRSRIPGFLGGGTGGTPFDLQYTHDGFRAALQNQLEAMPRTDWALAEVTIRVEG